MLLVCVARLFYASDLFVHYLPMPLADGSQTADLFGSASRRQCSVGGALSRRPWGDAWRTPASSPFDGAFSPSPGLFLILRSASHGSLKTVDRFLQDRSVGKSD